MNITGVLGNFGDVLFYTIMPFVLVLGFMIFVHELGHYLAARLVGVRVLVFKLGFGKYLWSTRRGPTEYGIGWMPLGGYVRLFGDPSEIEGEEHDTPLEEITDVDKSEALFYKPAWAKLLTFIAGPFMNIALAFILAPLVFLSGVPVVPPVVGMVEPDSPAMTAGIQPGDRVLAINGEPVDSYEQVKWQEVLNPEQTLIYTVSRNGGKLDIPLTLRKSLNEKTGPVGESGITEPISTRIGAILKDSAAEKAGLLAGDTIARVNEVPVSQWGSLKNEIAGSEGRPTEFLVMRAGKPMNFTITPRLNKETKSYLVGITPFQETEIKKYGLIASIGKGAEYSAGFVYKTYVILWKLISFQLSPKVMSGPLGIGAITSQAAHAGATALIGLTVLISINLGVLNLLPFPPLDGGHILFTAVEAVLRREVNMKYKELTFRVGFILLIGLMLLVTFNDFVRYKSDMWDFMMQIGKGLGIG